MSEAVEELKAVVDDWNLDADNDDEVHWHGDYSGRFMYGAECIGISGDTFSLTEVWANLDPEYRKELGKPTTDSLGMGQIWYWPGVDA